MSLVRQMTGQKLRPPGSGVREKKTRRIVSHAATPQALRLCRAEDETLHAATPKLDDLRNRSDPVPLRSVEGSPNNQLLRTPIFHNEVSDPRKPLLDHGETISP